MNPASGLAALRQSAAAAASLAHCRSPLPPLQHLHSLLVPAPSHPVQPSAQGYAAAAQPLESEPDLPSNTERRGPNRPSFTPLKFDDPATAFITKTSGELALAYATFTACQIKPLVDNADAMLKWSKRLLGETIVSAILRRTFFRHFCAGETQEDIRPRVMALYEAGIGSILDYAAEDDLGAEADGAATRSDGRGTAVARTFEYNTEAICDAHMRTFLQSISAAAEAPGQGFAAIKVTALGNPKLLERVSAGLSAIKNLFSQFDLNHDDVITREEFSTVYAELFEDSSPERLQQLFRYLDPDGNGVLDFLSWSRCIRLQDIPKVIQRCKAPGPLYETTLSEDELQLLDSLMGRLYRCAEAAVASNVRLMIDAEHSWFQPAIDHAATELQRSFNTHSPTILNTYQCYLRDSRTRFALDLERSRREGYRFGAKLVRGAYMFLERERAAKSGRPCPIWDSIQDTHANYDRVVQDALTAVEADGAEVMIASHNQGSVEAAVSSMHERGLDHTSAGVYFGQLLGMADPLTYVLGAHGYRAYKYVPFGKVDEVIPYLVRRAQENSTVLGSVQQEKVMVAAELRRRMAGRRRRQA